MNSQFAELYEKSIRVYEEGDIVKGTIVAVRSREVVIDIGYKSEGILPLDEFSNPSEVTVGMELDVLFETFLDAEGIVVVSKRKADRQRTWNSLLSNAEEGSIV